MNKSKDLDTCDYCYIFHNYHKSLKKYSYEKLDDLIDDDGDDDNAVDRYGNDLDNNHRCQFGGAKYTINKSKAACPFITFADNPILLFEGTIQKLNNPDKGRNIMHQHRVFHSDHGLVSEYPFASLQR